MWWWQKETKDVWEMWENWHFDPHDTDTLYINDCSDSASSKLLFVFVLFPGCHHLQQPWHPKGTSHTTSSSKWDSFISCTPASLPRSLAGLCFLPLRGNISSATLRGWCSLPVVFPWGLWRCQSGARRQRAKKFAIDLVHANNACVRRSYTLGGPAHLQRHILTSAAVRFFGKRPLAPAHPWTLLFTYLIPKIV